MPFIWLAGLGLSAVIVWKGSDALDNGTKLTYAGLAAFGAYVLWQKFK